MPGWASLIGHPEVTRLLRSSLSTGAILLLSRLGRADAVEVFESSFEILVEKLRLGAIPLDRIASSMIELLRTACVSGRTSQDEFVFWERATYLSRLKPVELQVLRRSYVDGENYRAIARTLYMDEAECFRIQQQTTAVFEIQGRRSC